MSMCLQVRTVNLGLAARGRGTRSAIVHRFATFQANRSPKPKEPDPRRGQYCARACDSQVRAAPSSAGLIALGVAAELQQFSQY